MAKKISTQEKEQRALARHIRKIFLTCGFHENENTRKTLKFLTKDFEFDGIYTFGQFVIITEDTTGEPKDHFKKKALTIDFIKSNKSVFINFLRDNSDDDPHLGNKSLTDNAFKLLFLYCSKDTLDPVHLVGLSHIKYWDLSTLTYFSYLIRAIGKSARFELYRFFGIKAHDLSIGASVISAQSFRAFVIPEAPSGYPADCRLVTFYVDPEALLQRAYVLRRDGWEAKDELYQRMVKANKIKTMRKYLAEAGRVYANNIIVALPNSARFTKGGKPVDKTEITQLKQLTVWLDNEFNSVGIIDGQHRVYSYHEADDDLEIDIAPLRASQHLLATGIIFPKSHTPSARRTLQAKLFLEINDKQTRTSSLLRQQIRSITEPFDHISIAKHVIDGMAKTGPLSGCLQLGSLDKAPIKTPSIVAYGLVRLVKPVQNEPTLYAAWKSPKKKKLHKGDLNALDEYITYCVDSLNTYFLAFKQHGIEKICWTDDKHQSMVLTTTSINGLIHCAIRAIKEDKWKGKNTHIKAFEYLKKSTFSFEPTAFRYRSSRWALLGDVLYSFSFEKI